MTQARILFLMHKSHRNKQQLQPLHELEISAAAIEVVLLETYRRGQETSSLRAIFHNDDTCQPLKHVMGIHLGLNVFLQPKPRTS
jgi:hypothetical protein